MLKIIDDRPDYAAELRQRAEEIVAQVSENLDAMSPEEMRQTLNELRVHQIALEMQNEELRWAHAELDASRMRHFDYYDEAPVGYFTISENGLILEINLTAATLLGFNRSAVVNQPITRFMRKEDQEVYCLHLKQLCESSEPQAYELRMVKKNGTALWAHLEATAVQNANGKRVYRIIMSDITERKLAEETLRLSEEKYQQLFSEMIFGSALHELVYDNHGEAIDYRMIEVNKAFENILGVRKEQVVGQLASVFLSSEELIKWLVLFAPVAHGEGPRVYEQYSPLTYQYFEGIVFSPKHGQFAVTFIDVTERKRVEEALRASSLYSRTLIETSLDPLVTISAEGKITDVNSATEKITGLSRRRLIGSDFTEYFTEPENARAWYLKAFMEGQVIDCPLAVRHSSGSVTDVVYNASVYRDEQGKVLGVFAAARDITERKRAEEALRISKEKYHRIASSMTDYLYTVEIHENKPVETIHNPSCITVTGYAAEEFEARPDLWIEMVPEEDRELILKQVEEVLSGAHNPLSIEHRIIRKDGSLRWVRNTPVPHRDAQGRLLSYDGVITDVTERKLTEEVIRESTREREKLIKDLQNALGKIKTLQGLIPICTNCKKVRDAHGFWNQLEEASFSEHTDVSFTYGICPECRETLYGDRFKKEQ